MEMKPDPKKEESDEAARSKFMDIIMNDTKYSSNLNKLFDSFGCNTLEAKVPIMDDVEIEQLKNADVRQRKLVTLAHKSKSAASALGGRAPRTKNRQVKVVEIAGETVICAGETRDRSPVNKCDLDSELDDYMKEAVRVRSRESDWPLDDISAKKNVVKDEVKDEQQQLDDELEAYKKERLRLRAQKQVTAELSNRFTEREAFDDDNMEF